MSKQQHYSSLLSLAHSLSSAIPKHRPSNFGLRPCLLGDCMTDGRNRPHPEIFWPACLDCLQRGLRPRQPSRRTDNRTALPPPWTRGQPGGRKVFPDCRIGSTLRFLVPWPYMCLSTAACFYRFRRAGDSPLACRGIFQKQSQHFEERELIFLFSSGAN